MRSVSHLSTIKRHLAEAYRYRNWARRNLDKPKIKDLEDALIYLEKVSQNLIYAKVELQQEIAERHREEYLKSLKDKKPETKECNTKEQ